MPERWQLRQTIHVDDIRIEAFIGVHGHEKNRRQSLIVGAKLDVIPPRNDAIAETIDYNTIVEHSRALADEGIALIEVFASRLAHALMGDSRVLSAEVVVIKPGALPNGTASTSTTLARVTNE